MILSDTRILEEIKNKNIIIEPFERDCLGTNSYDVHLGRYLGTYKDDILDSKRHNEIEIFTIPDDGYVLKPGTLYLGVTHEYTESLTTVPFLEGKSSIGRLGINIHATAGKGDVGYKNHWTLEISVCQPVKVYPLMPVGQIIYFEVSGDIEIPYFKKPTASYTQRYNKPRESMLFKYFERITCKE